jgi:hypothetical protein
MRVTSYLFPLTFCVALTAQNVPAPGREVDPRPNAGSQLGINVADYTYYSSELIFKDLMRGCSEWVPQLVHGGPWNTGASFVARSDGYPAALAPQQALATIIQSVSGRYPGGPYVVLWDGDGDVEVRWDAVVARQQSNRIDCLVYPQDGILLRITRTNPANPVRNVRVVAAADEASYRTQPFHSSFRNRWAIMKVIRFMLWQKTGIATQANWSERVPPDYYTQQGREGMAVEHMIDVCNVLDVDPWFCMPHLCTDDYVRQFARLVASRLRPGLRIYVEYSNECWNNGFAQAHYCQKMGVRLGLSTDPYIAQLRFYSQRAVEIFGIWAQEIARPRLLRVLAGQNVNTWATQLILDWQNAYQSADCWALNVYFGFPLGNPENQFRVQHMTPEAILAECAQDMIPALGLSAQQHVLAQARNLTTIAFEAGQHMVAVGSARQNTVVVQKLAAANRIPGMRLVYDQFLTEWRRIGGELCCLYNSTGLYGVDGSWGLFEDGLQSMWQAPKYLGAFDYLVRNWR